MMHLQLLNESLGRFNENFGAFLYGMNMSAFCVDFPEVGTAHLKATERVLTWHQGTNSAIFRPAQGHAVPHAGVALS